MTSARQINRYSVGIAAFLCAAIGFSMAPPPVAALSDRIVVDWHSGLAIGGYDPVAFFTEGKPLLGSADFEARFGGAIWRFRNSGNRAAFLERPDVYMPQYGGYDPVGVARSVAVPGHPDVWIIVGERLFLFYDPDQREKFAAASDRFLAAAARNWPQVLRTLTP